MSKHTEVVFSETESRVLKLKVGRCNATDFDQNVLLHEMVTGSYDVCRLKVPSEDEMAALKLDSIGIPYSFSGSIRRYRTPIPEYPKASMRHPVLEFIPYNGEEAHDEILKFMLEETWGDYPIGYYRSPLLHNFCSKETEIESVFQFYRKFNNNQIYSQNSIMFMKDNGEFVGFFALNIVGDHLESHIGGIIRKHRRSGYFHDMLHYIRRFCVDNHLGHFVFGARNENAAVQKAFEQEGFNSIGSENVFHLAPFLSAAAGQEQHYLNQSFNDFQMLREHIGRTVFSLNTALSDMPLSKQHHIRLCQEKSEIVGDHFTTCKLVDSETEQLIIAKVFDKKLKLINLSYFHCRIWMQN